MKKASTVNEIYNIFTSEHALSVNEGDFYIDLYGNSFKKFVISLKNPSSTNESFYIAGQSGNGKSTVLNLLTVNHPELYQQYDFLYLRGKEVFSQKDIDIVDIMLMIGNTIARKSESLQETYRDKLKDIADIKKGNFIVESTSSNHKKIETSSTASMHVGVKFFNILKSGIDFMASYKLNEAIRHDARRLFKVRRAELITLINEMLLAYKIEKNNDKNILIIIDDLEKIDDADSLFVNDMELLNHLDLLKIVTMPIYLYRKENIRYATVSEFSLKLQYMDGRNNPAHRLLLQKVIDARIADKQLITEDAIALAIENSSGNLRQLMRIISAASLDALLYEADKINKKNVEIALEDLGRELSPKVMQMLGFLNEIKENKGHDDSEKGYENIARASKLQLVVAHFNGVVWYEVNPLIKNVIDIYNTMK